MGLDLPRGTPVPSLRVHSGCLLRTEGQSLAGEDQGQDSAALAIFPSCAEELLYDLENILSLPLSFPLSNEAYEEVSYVAW